MLLDQISKKVAREIKERTWGVTEQFLEIHDLVLVDGQPTIERVDSEKPDGTVIAYLPVRDQPFYFAIYFDGKESLNINGVGTEPFNSVYFSATSEKLSFDQMCSLTSLRSTSGWNKGDKGRFGNKVYEVSSFQFEPNPEPDEIDDKLAKLLNLLESDKDGIGGLVDECEGYIQVRTVFHNGNTMLGGPHLDKQTIRRLSDLDLAINFDLYATGKFFMEDEAKS